MLLEEYQAPITGKEIVFILIGLGIAFIVMFFWRMWKSWMTHEQKEHVIFIDITTWKARYVGQFDGYRDLRIGVENGRSKEFWGICALFKNGPRYVVPSFGEKNDIVLWDKTYLKTHIFIIGILIGMGHEGKTVHEQWMADAFPPEVYDFGEPIDVPHQFWLCKPLWNQEMKKSIYIDNLFEVQGVYTMYQHQLAVYDNQKNLIQNELSSLMVKRMQAGTDHTLTQWSKVVDAWNTLHAERTVPLSVLTALLHISPSKVMYAGLNQALNQGSIQAAVPFVQNIRGMLEDLSDSVGMHMMDKTKLTLLEARVNQEMQSASSLAQENIEKERELEILRSQMMQIRAQGGLPSSGKIPI